jgi:D-arabinose 1-dehydrogenase-like Zn-dependent alcohol dehydrogenase
VARAGPDLWPVPVIVVGTAFATGGERSAERLAAGDDMRCARGPGAGLTAYHAVRKAIPALDPGSFAVTVGAGGLVLGEVTIAANLIGTYPDLAGLVTLADQGQAALRCARYPLEATGDAIDDLRHGRIRGRAILIPG